MVCHLASDGRLQFSKNCIVFLEIRNLENLLLSTACLNLLNRHIFVLSTNLVNRSTVWPSGWERAHQVNSIATDREDRGFGPRSCNFFLRFSKMFLWISMDAIYNCNRLICNQIIYLFPQIIFIIIIFGNKSPYWLANKTNYYMTNSYRPGVKKFDWLKAGL